MPKYLKLRGVASVTLDAKGRMALPSRHREIVAAEAEGRVVVTASPYDSCLYLYPRPVWEPVQEQLDAQPNTDLGARRLQQIMIGQATDLELDKAGRLLLPAKLREWAQLDKKLCVVGMGDKIEIWDDGRWNATMQAAQKGSISAEPGVDEPGAVAEKGSTSAEPGVDEPGAVADFLNRSGLSL